MRTLRRPPRANLPTATQETPAPYVGSSNNRISLVFATRNRPENLRRFYQSVKNTAHELPEICVYIDNDDLVSVAVAKELGFKYVQGSRLPLAQCYNAAANLATGNILMFAGDDLIFRKKGWDSMVRSEFNRYSDKIIFVYGHDGHQGERLGTHGFLHRRWIQAVGYFVPPYYCKDYFDQWITEVADALGRKVYLPVILAEHMHHIWGKAPMDSTYSESLAKPHYDVDGLSYEDRAPQRTLDVKKLKGLIQ